MLIGLLSFSTAAFADDGQNPVMNFIGRYGENRATIDVSCEGDIGAKFEVSWGASAAQTAKWEMSGIFDPNTLTVTYDNCTKKVVTFEDENSSGTETIEYKNGKGSFTFSNSGTLTWDDQEEHIADGTVFTYSSYTPEEKPNPGKMVGGWAAAEDPTITDEMRTMLTQALKQYQDGSKAVSYTPVTYLGSQVVAGVNRAILCKTEEANGTTGWAVVYLYQDPQHNVSVLGIDELKLGIN